MAVRRGLRKQPAEDAIPLRKLVPGRPQEENELLKLGEDSVQMGCEGLLGLPWNFKDQPMVK